MGKISKKLSIIQEIEGKGYFSTPYFHIKKLATASKEKKKFGFFCIFSWQKFEDKYFQKIYCQIRYIQ